MLYGSHISLKGERKGIRKFNISYGAGGGIRTHKSLAQGILSPSCMPFHHTRIYKTFIFGLVAFANSAIPLYLSGEPRFELGSQLRQRDLVSITKKLFCSESLYLYLIYILYHIFYKKSNIIFWLPTLDSNQDYLLQRDNGFRDRRPTIRRVGNIEDKDFFIFFILYKYYIIFF